MTLRVIGAGMGRTGTLSLKLALEVLGFGPCHHMNSLLADPTTVSHWEDAWRGRPVNWDAIYDGFCSAVDFPTYPHWRALAAHSPGARVILTVRDAEKWYESTLTTTYRAYLHGQRSKDSRPLPLSRRARQLSRVLRGTARLWEVDFDGRFEDRAFSMERFAQHNREVIETLPPDRLLVFSVAEGWGPLCEFLDVEPPTGMPFPRANDREAFHAHLESIEPP